MKQTIFCHWGAWKSDHIFPYITNGEKIPDFFKIHRNAKGDFSVIIIRITILFGVSVAYNFHTEIQESHLPI